MYTIVDIDVEENAGLRTVDGLRVLHDEIKFVLDDYERKIRDRSVHSSIRANVNLHERPSACKFNLLSCCRCPWKEGGWLRDALHFSSPDSTLCWTSALTMIVCGLVLIVASIFHEDSR